MEIGTKPERCPVNLARGGDFNAVLEATGDEDAPVDYPAGTTIRLDILDKVGGLLDSWDATVAGSSATFDVDKADVDAVLDTKPFDGKTGRLYYINGADDVLWAVGPVKEF